MTCICREGWTGTQCTDLIATEELMSLAVEKSAPKGKSALMRKTEHCECPYGIAACFFLKIFHNIK